jgi:hypothetical protein
MLRRTVIQSALRRFKRHREDPSVVTGEQTSVSAGQTVYDFAAFLAERYCCVRLLDVGRTHVTSLVRSTSETGLPGTGTGPGSGACGLAAEQHYVAREQIRHDFARRPFRLPDRDIIRGSLVVCAGVMAHLAQTSHLLSSLRDLLEYAPVAIVTAPFRSRGREDLGSSAGPVRCRDWDLPEFRVLLESAGLEVLFQGLASSDCANRHKRTILCIARKPISTPSVPARFRVVAFAGAYNEEDVIVPFLDHTIAQGVDVCLLDNWSTDRTAERAARFLGRGLIAILKFPSNGPVRTHEWRNMLTRKAELAHQTEADWFIHVDPDEIRESPWPGLTLREALFRVDREGFNAVDHTCLVFHPTGGGFCPNVSLQSQFSHFEFGTRPGHFLQIKAWKRQPEPVDCASSGGHEVRFAGRRVYPFKFLLRHYPIRSQEHGERKIYRDRLPRFSPALRQVGWHTQYDTLGPKHSFVRNPDTLLAFDPQRFYEEYLVERLSGVGVAGHTAVPGAHSGR